MTQPNNLKPDKYEEGIILKPKPYKRNWKFVKYKPDGNHIMIKDDVVLIEDEEIPSIQNFVKLLAEMEFDDVYEGTNASVYICSRCEDKFIMSNKAPCPNCHPEANAFARKYGTQPKKSQ